MTGKRHPRRLSFQPLEHRHLLVAASFSLNFYQSDGGAPGAELSGPVTGDFFVEVSGVEQDPLLDGFRGVSLNLQWDPAMISLIEEDFDLNQIFSADLPAYRQGTFDQAAGRIYNLSAAQVQEIGLGSAIGDGEVASIALLHFTAVSETSSTGIKIWEGASGIYPTPYVRWQRGDIEFENRSIAIDFPTQDAERLEMSLDSPPADSIADSTGTQTLPEHSRQSDPVEDVSGGESGDQARDPSASDDDQFPADALIHQPEPLVWSTAPDGDQTAGIDSTVVADSSSELDAALVDQALSFDFNGDGIFDLGDFGLLNLVVRPGDGLTAPNESAMGTGERDASLSDGEAAETLETANPTPMTHRFCTAAPPREDEEAFEAWLDALANAWIADSDARQRRRQAAVV